ncbi:hypothetical protein M426DRAFT_320471 [Hypoxylon sp. CI-4A]|nr:hypothetical protein M426DRAFT_320471 [Hypoxylon sp. CI-4A]
MKKSFGALLALAGAVSADVPSLEVPACTSGTGTATYSTSNPIGEGFPETKVDLCYDDSNIQVTFTALGELNYYFNKSQTTNGEIWKYEVMESFIALGTEDPDTYFEYEINPNNVTFQAFIYNPSKTRADGAPFETTFLDEVLPAETQQDRSAETWISSAAIPLRLFNVTDAAGTEWRMNFFRTVGSPEAGLDQLLGAWSPTNESNFHMTPFFGYITFV